MKEFRPKLPKMKPEFLIYTTKRDDEHPRGFHMGVHQREFVKIYPEPEEDSHDVS